MTFTPNTHPVTDKQRHNTWVHVYTINKQSIDVIFRFQNIRSISRKSVYAASGGIS
ncbi:hypothetical protein ABSL22_001052 [Escherichia coli]|nr:hypothetical protein [Escherichia coli]EHE9874215.1 hypothetical protein [Escherichia coli]EJE3858414.1 hypothetical protein [Escherichia coli]EJZ1813279.1 hypothetical protein [Escherichia coli]EKI8155005.1 hypothetical protein [Escherichia coli]